MIRIITGDCREELARLPAESVHCCVTSPPYFGLRNYGVDGQIGLEDTLETYVETMVSVFREVRRVLRKDGTVWLNLGDSYAASPKGNLNGQDKSGLTSTRTQENSPTGINKLRLGYKPKDLMMIPARVALALQAPFYTGLIKDERDRVWLAAMVDGEGCMFIHKRKIGQNNGQGYDRKSNSYGSGLEVANTIQSIVERCKEITGLGSICRQDKDRKQPLYRWNLRSNECREVIREIYPHLVGKQEQARVLIGCPSSGEKAAAAHKSLIALHNGGQSTIDFPVPDSMWEPGWYVRSDVIWSKKNPMPESVTDRPTSAHEHVFLLAKSAKYYFDAEAVRERGNGWNGSSFTSAQDIATKPGLGQAERVEQAGRNLRNVWSIATAPFSEAHFATFPPKLVEPCIKAGCPEDGIVLDPFGGAGTTGLVADRLGRNAILIELNPEYASMARERITKDGPLFAEVSGACQ